MRKTILLLAASLMLAGSIQAQEAWATARLDKTPRHGEFVKLKHDSREVEGFLTRPEAAGKVTGVVVIHEIYGLSDWARSVTDELAEAGYVALAPDLLWGKGPNGGGTVELGGRSGAQRAIGSLPPDQITADLNAAVDYVSKLPYCNGKVVVIGFCWGGGQTFRFATNNKDIKAALSFYGPIPKDDTAFARIACPVYGFYAEKDGITASVPQATTAMKAAGKTYEPVIYDGAGHGFMREGEDPASKTENHEANVKAHDASWTRIKEILKKI